MQKRTVHQTRELLHKPAIAPRVWGVLRRKAVFGWTEASVRSQLYTITWCGKRFAVHRKVVASMKRVEDRIRRREKAKGWDAWMPERVECFNWRTIRGGTSLSRHAHAIALDIDPRTNPYYDHYKSGLWMDIPPYVIQAFMDEGWTWGGSWSSPCDTMHMQYA